MHRFVIGPGFGTGDEAALPEEEAAHAVRVLRLKQDDAVELLDGQGARYAGTIVRATRGEVIVRLGGRMPDAEPPVDVTLYMGLPKFDKLDFIVQKAAELGARRIVPVRMERSVVKLDEREGEKRRERLERVAVEAAKQCGRARPPQIAAPRSWRDALDGMAAQDLMLMPWEEAHERHLRELAARTPANIGLLIGPEGGISEREARLAIECGALAVTLGPRILRAETAAIAALSLIMQLWGDL